MNSFNCGEGEARTVSAPELRGQILSRKGEARAHPRQSPSREGEAQAARAKPETP